MEFHKHITKEEQVKRDKIFFKYPQVEQVYKDDVVRFTGLGAEKLAELVSNGWLNPKDRYIRSGKHRSPTYADVIGFVKENPEFWVSGTAGSSDLADARVYLDYICGKKVTYEKMQKLLTFCKGAEFISITGQYDTYTCYVMWAPLQTI